MNESKQSLAGLDMRRIRNREDFVYSLDMEVKRSRRYQEFFSIILLKLMKPPHPVEEVVVKSCYEMLTEVLAEEIRETDILGAVGEDKIAILLPYANQESAELAQSRFCGFLEPYDFTGKGCDIEYEHVCFPLGGATTIDILKKVIDIS